MITSKTEYNSQALRMAGRQDKMHSLACVGEQLEIELGKLFEKDGNPLRFTGVQVQHICDTIKGNQRLINAILSELRQVEKGEIEE